MKISFLHTVYYLPDFLIIGGARCGTSSLYSYLKEHAEIFMPNLKEPHFFNYLESKRSPHPNRPPWTIEDYAALFTPASPGQKLGEASASYLYFNDKVIPTMRSIYGNKAREVKIIIVLRNPIERAWSYHMLLRRSGHEMNFFEMVDKYCGGEKKAFHDFIRAGRYTEQVEDYLRSFESVNIFMYEDLKNDPIGVVRNIFEKIGINNTEFIPPNINTTYNASGSPKPGLNRLLYNLLFHNISIKRLFKHILPLRWRLWIKAEVSARIMKKVEMPSDVREFLKKSYSDSMESLRSLLSDPAQKAVVDKWITHL